MAAGWRLLWSIGLAGREGAWLQNVVTHFWFPVSGGSWLSLSITSFIFQFFFNPGLWSRASWWGRQPLCHTRPAGTGVPPPRVDKAVKGLGMVPSPLDAPCISCICLHLWLIPLWAWLCCLLPDTAQPCSLCSSAVICAAPELSRAGDVGWPPSAPSIAEHGDVENNPTVANHVCSKTAFALTIALILALLD